MDERERRIRTLIGYAGMVFFFVLGMWWFWSIVRDL